MHSLRAVLDFVSVIYRFTLHTRLSGCVHLETGTFTKTKYSDIMSFKNIIVCVYFLVVFHHCDGGTWTEVKDQHVLLYDAYSIRFDAYVDTIPRSNPSSPIDVTLGFDLYALADYDAVSGSVELMGSLSMNWTDEIETLKGITFNPTVTDDIVVDYSKLWTPVIVLMNSVDSIKRVGDETYKVRFNLTSGITTWAPRMILNAACTPDVTYFPFDEQTCVLRFVPWFADSTMVRLLVSSSTWNLDQYAGNGVWEIQSTKAETVLLGSYYYADFTITFSRQPVYFTVNLVLPVLLLSLLTGFVFLLPAASGERVGFTVTCFLSFVVLLQTMMKFLPEASAPMSLFCYYVIVMMLFSGLVCIVTILLLRVHHKAEHGKAVWRWLAHLIQVINCVKCKRMKCCKKNSIEDASESSSSSEIEMIKVKHEMPKRQVFNSKKSVPVRIEVKESKENAKNGDNRDDVSSNSDDTVNDLSDVSWEDVTRELDKFFFLAFIGAQCAFSIFFLVPLGSRA